MFHILIIKLDQDQKQINRKKNDTFERINTFYQD